MSGDNATPAAARDRRSRLMAASIANLLRGRAPRIGFASVSPTAVDDPLVGVVALVAERFGMRADDLHLPDAVARSMDDLTRLRRLADKAGLRLRLITLPAGWERRDSGMLIGFYGQERSPVALLPRGKKEYAIYSAAWPEGRGISQEESSTLCREAFVCYAGLPPEKLTVGQALSFIMRGVWTNDWRDIALISLLAGLLPLALPLIIESIFKHIIPVNDRQALGTAAQVILAIGFAQFALTLARSVACLRLKTYFGAALEAALWSRLVNLPMTFFRNRQAGDLMNRMGGAAQVASLLDGAVAATLFNALFSFFSLLLMFHYSIRLTLWACLIWLVYLLAAALLYQRALTWQRRAIEAGNLVMARVLQLFDGMSVFKLRAAEETAFYLWSKVCGDKWRWDLTLRRQGHRIALLNVIQPLIMSMAIYYLTADMMNGTAHGWGQLTIEEFLAFQTLFAGFNASLMQFVPLVSTFYGVLPHIENLEPVLAETPESNADLADVGVLTGCVEAKGIHFRYNPETPPVLREVSFSIRPGQFAAFVGMSGCGKSTLVRLLLGFENPERGSILYNSLNLESLDVKSVRSQIGVVLQHGRLMAGDIFSNIVGTLPLSEDDAWEAARLVGLAGDIERMPMGMRTYISEGGTNISGGQRQRIFLARCLVNRPKIVILDEATSTLDNITQATVAESLNRLGATRIVVAHRLSTIRSADRIFVMDSGRIVEEGNYSELVARGGWFTRLASRQLL